MREERGVFPGYRAVSAIAATEGKAGPHTPSKTLLHGRAKQLIQMSGSPPASHVLSVSQAVCKKGTDLLFPRERFARLPPSST